MLWADVTVGGWVEASYSHNFNEPANGITAARGFDTHAESLTLENAVVDLHAKEGRANARIALQVGNTPDVYYAAEPGDRTLYRHVHEAHAGWLAPLGERGLMLEVGVFLSPIGLEAMAVHDDWNWTRSTLFYALPFYHLGARATKELSERFTYQAGVYNGWNDIVDQNQEKSVSESLTYKSPGDEVAATLLYFGGVERAPGAPEGRAWRHLFDASATGRVTKHLWLAAEGDSGFEVTELGTSSWLSGALYGRVQIAPFLFVAVRGDVLHEHTGRAAPIFFAANTVGSETVTLDVHPDDHVSFRVDLRHDQASAPLYFQGGAPPTRPNATSQTTLTLGATAWF